MRGLQRRRLNEIEMNFLPDVWVTCDVCKGKRYTREALEVKWRGKTIFDILEMPVEEASKFFANQKKIHRILSTLEDVGLGYIRLGQPATTLSGGEAQRVKLATELHRPARKHTVYILDEPTTGLAMSDVHQLISCPEIAKNRHSHHHRTSPRCRKVRRLGSRPGSRRRRTRWSDRSRRNPSRSSK